MNGLSGSDRPATQTALGCLAYLILFGALAAAIDRWTAPQVVPEARPWLGIGAALCFTLALGSAWTLVSGLLNRGRSRAAILERAAAGTLPDEDGVSVVTGTVRAATLPLQSPLTGTPCVAYTYRMFHQVRNHKGRLEDVPIYWGLASRPFIVDTRMRAVRVMAVPWIVDEATRCDGAGVVTRARQHVGTTRFEDVSGLLGAVGTVFSTVRVMFQDEDGEHRADYRAAGTTRAPETLLLEETVLPVGAVASVAGTWSAARGAIVTASGTAVTGGVTATSGPVDTLLKRSTQVPASTTSTALFVVVLAAFGAGILWAATTYLGPGSPYVPR